uniref:Uncharacterized protein n=1 Tax=Oryza brachyantha TaxID=4533 RepID=J3MTH0_ORYBR
MHCASPDAPKRQGARLVAAVSLLLLSDEIVPKDTLVQKCSRIAQLPLQRSRSFCTCN